jgi:hypothetical protein
MGIRWVTRGMSIKFSLRRKVHPGDQTIALFVANSFKYSIHYDTCTVPVDLNI